MGSSCSTKSVPKYLGCTKAAADGQEGGAKMTFEEVIIGQNYPGTVVSTGIVLSLSWQLFMKCGSEA